MEYSKFIRVKCPRCSNTQTAYSRSTIWLKCKICNKLILKPQGGKAKIKAFIKNVLN